jgi:hypothetical protein
MSRSNENVAAGDPIAVGVAKASNLTSGKSLGKVERPLVH